jgi:hypothetical protein
MCFDLLLDKANNLESKKLRLAEEEAKFYERPLGLQDSYVKLLEWSDAEKAKKIKVLEKKKKYQDVLDLNSKEYDEAQQEVRTWMRITSASITTWTYFICVTARPWTPRSQ